MDITASGFEHIDVIQQDALLNSDEFILIVDDDPMIRTPIRIFFEENGLPVIEADSGHACLEILASHHVALALLDIGLPDQSGRDVLAQTREKYPLLAVIMLTGNADLKTAMECIRQGADDFLA